MPEIPLRDGGFTVVDDSDYDDAVAAGPWHASQRYGDTIYARRSFKNASGRWTTQCLHNFLMGRAGIDHADGDGLNNRRSNLRPASKSQNGANRGKNSNNTSGFKGVSPRKGSLPWMARIGHDGKSVYLGKFPTAEDAARAYNSAALELFGEFAHLNELP